MKNLTIAIATNKNCINFLLKKLNTYSEVFEDKIKFLIVWQQCSDSLQNDFKVKDNIEVFESETKGLSAARNECIQYTNTRWIWFQDDDISLNVDEVNKLLWKLDTSQTDLFFLKVLSTENIGLPYKNYDFHNSNTNLNSLKISSIEIVANSNFIKNNNIVFDENLGLGTSMPCCEENLFVLNCMRMKARIYFADIYACFHTTDESLRISKSLNSFVARGYLLANLNVIAALILSFRWALRERSNLGFLPSLKNILSGYIRSKFS